MTSKVLLIVVILIATTLNLRAQQQAKPGSLGTMQQTSQNRFQLVAATVQSGDANEPTVFMIDTATGRVSKYQGPFESKDQKGVKTIASPVFISIPCGWTGG
jgi:hypothetical protein